MKKLNILIMSLVALALVSCDNFLDRPPLSDPATSSYFKSESDLAAYSAKQYESAEFNTIWPGQYGIATFGSDNNTDNQAAVNPSGVWMPGEWKIPASGAGWSFGNIRNCNYFFDNVLPKYEKGEINGNKKNIEQYIGEMYVMRANIYFNKLKSFGDFPIITKTLPDKADVLIEASKRRPRNEVARFILSDLDKAIALMSETTPNKKNRLSKDAALLLKSRVALFEGTWLKYHKGTAQVPGGEGWPGAKQEYLKDFKIDIDSEIAFFLGEAKSAAKQVADKMVTQLAKNTKIRLGFSKDLKPLNPYFDMFAVTDMDPYAEVIFWRAFATGQSTHNTQMELCSNGGGSGYTKGYMESFLMTNGLPIYDPASGYKGDNSIKDVRTNRDYRLQLFVKEKGDTAYYNKDKVVQMRPSAILEAGEKRSTTGYSVKKGMSYNGEMAELHHVGTIGSLILRGAEALLNYMEANYELDNSIDANSANYWKALRVRAGVDPDFNKTIAATDMSKEAKGDFGAYSHGKLINSTLYNIRRERRNEFIAEGMRWDDLRRWRSMDQIVEKPYIVEGFKIWNSDITAWYGDKLKVDADKGNVSPKEQSDYLRPYQRTKTNNIYYDGYKWTEAHYLSPLPYAAFKLTATDQNVDNSVVYQNPHWGIQTGESFAK